MKKRTFFCIVKLTTTITRREGLQMKDIINSLTMKAVEQMTYRGLQKSVSQVMAQTVSELDEAIARGRDKSRFYLKDKRPLKFDSVFGSVELKRNYYQDKETGTYIYLLDHYLAFDGTKVMSPVVQDVAIELAVTGVSYRQ